MDKETQRKQDPYLKLFHPFAGGLPPASYLHHSPDDDEPRRWSSIFPFCIFTHNHTHSFIRILWLRHVIISEWTNETPVAFELWFDFTPIVGSVASYSLSIVQYQHINITYSSWTAGWWPWKEQNSEIKLGLQFQESPRVGNRCRMKLFSFRCNSVINKEELIKMSLIQ